MGAFTNRTALVTGGSKGIGYHIARHLAREGASIVLVARGAEELERAAMEISADCGVPTSYIVADLSTREGVSTLVDSVRSRDLTVDVLVNNAGFGIYDDYEKIDAEAETNMVGVNVTALTQLTREFVPGMVARRWGGVINISSILGYAGAPYMSTYGATKAYVLSFSYGLRAEVKPYDVRVTCVTPGSTETNFHSRSGRSSSAQPFSMSAEKVGKLAVKGLISGKALVVPGFGNKVLAFSTRFLPRRAAAFISAKILKARAH